MSTKHPPVLSAQEFRERVKAICGLREQNPLLTRTPKDKGYFPSLLQSAEDHRRKERYEQTR